MPKGRFGNRSMTSWDNISSASRTEISSYKGQYKVHHFLHSSLFWARSENKHHNISRVFCNQLEERSTMQHNRKTMRTLPLESTASPCLQTRHKSTHIWATVLILRSDKPAGIDHIFPVIPIWLIIEFFIDIIIFSSHGFYQPSFDCCELFWLSAGA